MAETQFLDQFVGVWLGEGQSNQQSIRDRNMRLIFTIKNANTIEMTKEFLEGERFKPYVIMTFNRE